MNSVDYKLLSSDELLEILSLSRNATAIYTTEELVIQLASDAMIAFWGKDRSVIGMTLEAAVPELAGQPFIDLLKSVWRSGNTYTAKDTAAELRINGQLQTFYYDFEYRAIKNNAGQVYCILHTATDVTADVINRKVIDNQKIRERKLIEELATSNEELSSSNEELTTINEELKESYDKLELLATDLSISEQKALYMIADAPVAMSIFTGRDLIIETANAKMLELWDAGTEVLGKPVHIALPATRIQPFLQTLDDVFTSGQAYTGTERRASGMRNGALSDFYYNFVYHPIKDDSGQTISIMTVAYDVTEQIEARSRVERSEYRLSQMVMNTPMGMTILKGRDLVVETANDTMLEIWDRTADQILGKRIMEVFPELVDQPFPRMLANVFDTGKGIALPEIGVDMMRADGQRERIFVDFSYDPLFNAAGEVESILASVIDITEMSTARKELEKHRVDLQELNEELTAINEEQQAANEELLATNEELVLTKNHLVTTNDKLLESENRFRAIVEQAPMGMCVLRGEEMIIELANDVILKIWGRTTEQTIGKSHKKARPELKGQPINAWMDEVYRTGIKRVNTEIKVTLFDAVTGTREAIINSVYQPLKDSEGNVNGVLVLIEDVTQRVTERHEAERMQEMFNRAVEAAELGTFDLNPATGKFTGNTLLKAWFGLQPEDEIELSDATDVISDDDRKRVIEEIKSAMVFANGGTYDTEYTILNTQTQIPRIVRAKGKVTFNEQQQAVRFNGTLQDITERKLDENRKNDFIAMVSHELKTPLTSTKAYVQMLSAKASKAGDYLTSGALDKIDLQVNKMNTLIKGFLDVARIESGKIHLNRQVFGLHELLTEVVDEATLISHSHDIQIHDCEDVMVEADRDKIGQVINNFITNAIKYSPKGKRILLSCKPNGNNINVSVKDEGMGIKPQDREKLFDRFYRVDSKHTKTISGFGIGLYLCAEIIQRHNGKVWVESEPGQGSTFSFSLPLA